MAERYVLGARCFSWIFLKKALGWRGLGLGRHPIFWEIKGHKTAKSEKWQAPPEQKYFFHRKSKNLQIFLDDLPNKKTLFTEPTTRNRRTYHCKDQNEPLQHENQPLQRGESSTTNRRTWPTTAKGVNPIIRDHAMTQNHDLEAPTTPCNPRNPRARGTPSLSISTFNPLEYWPYHFGP